MSMLAIKGHATRGKEVIEILEMLGGKNKYSHFGESESYFFFIQDGAIDCDEVRYADGYIIYTLEEFLRKFPYKVRDKVLLSGVVKIINQACWDDINDEVIYKLETNIRGFSEEYYVHHYNLQPYKEETMDKANKAVFDANAQCCDIMNHIIKGKTMEEIIKIDIPKGYEFAGVDNDNQKLVFTKIRPQYQKTYEECCEILSIPTYYKLRYYTYEHGYNEYTTLNKLCSLQDKLNILGKLLICRDAYWKIAGEQMGLGKPWEPDWLNVEQDKYVLYTHNNSICSNCYMLGNNILAFPTEEMRDAFYENFKDLIMECKELL